jgi:hypothetical protein
MAREQVTVDVVDRGVPLKFILKEMPATKLDSWTTRMLLLLGPLLGKDIGDFTDLESLISDVTTLQKLLTMTNQVDYYKLEVLLDEMYPYWYRLIDDGVELQCTKDKIDTIIYEIKTLWKLRLAFLKLNYSFLMEGGGDKAEEEKPSIIQTGKDILQRSKAKVRVAQTSQT